MTAILAVEHPVTGMLVIGADGRSTAGNSIVSEQSKKIIPMLKPKCFLGLAGEARGKALVQQFLEQFDESMDPWALVGKLRELLRNDSWTALGKEQDGGAQAFPVSGVIVYPEGVFRGIYDFCMGGAVVRIESGFPVGRGSGGELASAAFWGLLESGWPETETGLKSLVKTSIGIASRIDTGCGGEIQIFTC